MRPKVERHDPAVVFELQGSIQLCPVDAVAAHETHHDLDGEAFGKQATIVAPLCLPQRGRGVLGRRLDVGCCPRVRQVEVNKSP